MTQIRSTYFCVDLEANGPVPGLYDMVSIGAVTVIPDDKGALTIGEKFYVEIKPQAPKFDPRAAAIHGLDQDRLKQEGLERRTAMLNLADWVKKHTIDGSKPCFVAHNAPFDWSFIAWTYAAESLPNPFGYKALCTKAMATGALNLHWLDSNKETLETLLTLPKEDLNLKHRADYDAWYQAHILIELLKTLDT